MIKLTYLHWNNAQPSPYWISPEYIVWMNRGEWKDREATTVSMVGGYTFHIDETPDQILALAATAKTAT